MTEKQTEAKRQLDILMSLGVDCGVYMKMRGLVEFLSGPDRGDESPEFKAYQQHFLEALATVARVVEKVGGAEALGL